VRPEHPLPRFEEVVLLMDPIERLSAERRVAELGKLISEMDAKHIVASGEVWSESIPKRCVLVSERARLQLSLWHEPAHRSKTKT